MIFLQKYCDQSARIEHILLYCLSLQFKSSKYHYIFRELRCLADTHTSHRVVPSQMVTSLSSFKICSSYVARFREQHRDKSSWLSLKDWIYLTADLLIILCHFVSTLFPSALQHLNFFIIHFIISLSTQVPFSWLDFRLQGIVLPHFSKWQLILLKDLFTLLWKSFFFFLSLSFQDLALFSSLFLFLFLPFNFKYFIIFTMFKTFVLT